MMLSRQAIAGCAALMLSLSAAGEIPNANGSKAKPNAVEDRGSPAERAVVDDLIEQLQDQPIGDHHLRDLALPETFLRRAADRLLRESYRKKRHTVVRDDPSLPPEPEDVRIRPDIDVDAFKKRITIKSSSMGHDNLATWKAWEEQRPENRGFQPAIVATDESGWPIDLPQESESERLHDVAQQVAVTLAREGLLRTLARALKTLGADQFVEADASDLKRLRALGLPVDLLRHFHVKSGARPSAESVVSFVAERIEEGEQPGALSDLLDRVPFSWVRSDPTFEVTTESGRHELAHIRLQMTRGHYWRGIGAGGAIDMAQQIAHALPETSLTISIQEPFADSFLACVQEWEAPKPERISLFVEPLEVSQWAQDNAKPGHMMIDTRPVAIVPRFASRHEDGTVFVPGDTLLLANLARGGHRVVPSPLLFQGGNLLAVEDPATDERILLIGEAEIYRNTALGLSRAQVLEAFAAEFHVDRCVVLPAVSFHIDYELTVRVVNGKVIAFVNDELALARQIAALGVGALAKAGVISQNSASEAGRELQAGNVESFLSKIGPIVSALGSSGSYPQSVARHFSVSEVDSGVGNIHRLLVAVDTLVSDTWAPEQMTQDPTIQAYLRSYQRRRADRESLIEKLRALEWKVVRVPSNSEDERGINYVNGVHAKGLYLMPAYGGFYATLDEAAAKVFQKQLGEDVRIMPIHCAETQRRAGAVHCAVSAYYSK